MGILDIFKRNKNFKNAQSIVKFIYGGNVQLFANHYASNMYNIPEVRTAIEFFSDVFSTIPIYSKRVQRSGDITYFDDATSKVLALSPNPLQCSTQFWKSVITHLMLYNNVFIEPIYDNETGLLKEVYPLPMTSFDLYLENGQAFVKFYDHVVGYKEKYNLRSLIYLNRFNNLAGGNKKQALSLHETVLQALQNQAIEVANPKKPRAILQTKVGNSGNFKPADINGVMKGVGDNFQEDNIVNGLAYLENQYEITPINWQENDVNRELMKTIVNTVYNYFGLNEKIINNSASEIEYELFVNNRIKPLALQIEQELRRKLFTDKEIGFGNKIELDVFDLSVSTLSAKTALFAIASRQGLMNLDEMREKIGQPPIPNGLGKMYRVTGDTINLDKVDEYQAAQKGVKAENIQKEEINA